MQPRFSRSLTLPRPTRSHLTNIVLTKLKAALWLVVGFVAMIPSASAQRLTFTCPGIAYRPVHIVNPGTADAYNDPRLSYLGNLQSTEAVVSLSVDNAEAVGVPIAGTLYGAPWGTGYAILPGATNFVEVAIPAAYQIQVPAPLVFADVRRFVQGPNGFALVSTDLTQANNLGVDWAQGVATDGTPIRIRSKVEIRDTVPNLYRNSVLQTVALPATLIDPRDYQLDFEVWILGARGLTVVYGGCTAGIGDKGPGGSVCPDFGLSIGKVSSKKIKANGTAKISVKGKINKKLAKVAKYQWEVVAGNQAALLFYSPDKLSTKIEVSAPGDYKLQLTAIIGECKKSTTVDVHVGVK